MLAIGLTGGIGSGKSTVAKLFAEDGATIIDADNIAKQLTTRNSQHHQMIVDHFGEKVLTPENTLDRRLLRQLIFDDVVERHWLEQLLHPAIVAQIKRDIANAQGNYCIVVVPLLLEAKLTSLFDRILVVDATLALQRQRALARDNSDEAAIDLIIQQQCSREQRLAIADDVIVNSGDLTTLRERVDALILSYNAPK